MPDGLYAYYPPEHSLYRLGSSHARDDVKGVQLVLTGELTRVAAKYKTFAYRVVCLDAGVATLHVAILGKIYDVDVRLLPHWDEDELDRKYGLNYRDQAVTAVIELGRNV
ncbi:hypothetical protein CJ226_07185 [Microbacterium sp. UMB0228]|nr:hypothetical protein CJ226_07185 [Microbacterium sp. UMB0228]